VGSREAALILSSLPDEVRVLPEIAAVAAQALERMAARPDEYLLDVLASLDRRGMAPAAGPLAALIAADRDVTAFVEAASTEEFLADARYFRRMVARLGQAEPAVVGVRLRLVLNACLECPHPQVGGAVLGALAAAIREYRDGLTAAEFEKWSAEVRSRLQPEQVDTWTALLGHETHRPRINLWKTRDGGRS
jgi:hypothetical protein